MATGKTAAAGKAAKPTNEEALRGEVIEDEQPQHEHSTELSLSPVDAPVLPEHAQSLPTLHTGSPSTSPLIQPTGGAASASTPSLGRSFSLQAPPNASHSMPRAIPLRTLSRTTNLLSPLSSPSPSPPWLPNGTSMFGLGRTSPVVSLDGLTPAITLRTLQPVLTPSTGLSPASSTSSAYSDSASSLTPASAMRVLLTGQRDEPGNTSQLGTTTRRLSGRVSRDQSPVLLPLREEHSLLSASTSPASKHHKHSFSLTSPLGLPRVTSQDVDVTVPTLLRTSTTDRLDLTPSAAAAAALAITPSPTDHSSAQARLRDPNITHSLANMYDLPPPVSPSTLLTADESDSDDEGDTDVDPTTPSASSEVSVPTQHGLFFHRLLAHLPFTLPPALIRHIETSYAILITLSLFYTLFVDPIRLALLPPSLDLPLTLLLFLIFLLLLLELLFFLLSNPSYSRSLECVLDALACLSLLPQLYCMWTDRELTRLERAVMMMCRAGVMVRLVGVLRLLGAWEMWSHKGYESLMRGKWWWQHMRRKWRQRWKQRRHRAAHTDSSINLLRAERDHACDSDDEDEDALPPAEAEHAIHDGLTSVLYPSHASRIGQLLSDYTAHRVVLGVLFTLILWNYFHPHSVRTVHPYAIAHMDSLLDGHIANASTSSIEHSIQQYIDSYRAELLQLRMDGVTLYEQNATFAALRRHEKERIVTPHFDVWVNIKPWSQQFALFDFWSLLMVLLLLPVLLCLIYADVHAVVTPIERMCKFVTNLATDPMSEIGGADPTLSSSLQSLLPATTTSPFLNTGSLSASASLASGFSLDSFLVELTLQKLAILLQLVFGSAGANIIANNIRGDYLEVITPGRKVYAIFSFLTVEGWDEVMEVLEVEMAELMNCVAELVHSVCVLFGGEVNKNIGNAFLLVWKLEAEARRGAREAVDDEEANTGGERSRLHLESEKGRRQSHHHDERSGSLVVPSTFFPQALNVHLPQPSSPVRSMSITDSPPSPYLPSRASSQIQSASMSRYSPDIRQRKGRPPALPRAPAGASQSRYDLNSPVDIDSPPPLVHKELSTVPREIVDANGLKRRNSLLFGMLSLKSSDLSNIFTRSSMNIFAAGQETDRPGAEAAEEADEREVAAVPAVKEEKDVRHDVLSELPSQFSSDQHLPLPATQMSPAPATDSPLTSFYARTRPAPPLRRSHTWKDSAPNHRVAEHALSSFLLTLLQLSTSPALHKWRTHPQLASHHLSLQFAIGLHAGWAIEGAIGSSHKIDASYLSPNVNLSSRLSMLCHHYRLPLLFSSAFYQLLSSDVQKRCRRVDVVSVKGSRKPVGIYTFDVDFGEVEEMERARVEEWLKEGGPASGCAVGSSGAVGGSGSKPASGVHESYDERMRRRQVKEIDDIMRQLSRITKRRSARTAAPLSPGSVHASDEEDGDEHSRSRAGRRASAPSLPLAALSRSSSSSNLSSHSPLLPSLPDLLAAVQSHLPPAFIPLYNAACSCYLDGDWRSAGRLLVRVLTLRSGDGPSQLLLKVMAKEGFRAPTGWKGYRVLTKK